MSLWEDDEDSENSCTSKTVRRFLFPLLRLAAAATLVFDCLLVVDVIAAGSRVKGRATCSAGL